MTAVRGECCVCGRLFRREADKARHECVEERAQVCSVVFVCECWCRSKGGLAGIVI